MKEGSYMSDRISLKTGKEKCQPAKTVMPLSYAVNFTKGPEFKIQL